jgi:glycosyltransferase involved in cell wall biosynthesis
VFFVFFVSLWLIPLMKILLINDYSTETGGAEVFVLALREGLRQCGHDARLFSTSARPTGLVGKVDYECFGTASRFRTLLQTANPMAYYRLRKVLAEFKPDLVHVNLFLTQLSPLILPLLRHIPSIYHVHWYRPICPLGTKLLPDGSLCRVSAGAVCYSNGCLPLRDWVPLMFQMKLWRRWRDAFDLIIANSEAVKRYLLAEGIEPVEVVTYSIQSQKPGGPLSAEPTIAFAGRLVREKGVDLLLRAFAGVVARFPQARLLLAGEGPERETLHRLIADLDLSSYVSMLGHLSRSEMEKQFASAWAQVVPSLWAEPFGIVALEAMTRGTAVIASDCGGLREIVRDGRTGFLVPPGDREKLTEALLRLLEDRELAEGMGREGREFALANFFQDHPAEKFIQLYESFLNHKDTKDTKKK